MENGFLIAALVYVIACLGLVLFLQKQLGKLRTKVDALATLLKESDKQRESVKRELHELRSGTIGVGKRALSLRKSSPSKTPTLMKPVNRTLRQGCTPVP